jgi:hypothetical protein
MRPLWREEKRVNAKAQRRKGKEIRGCLFLLFSE